MQSMEIVAFENAAVVQQFAFCSALPPLQRAVDEGLSPFTCIPCTLVRPIIDITDGHGYRQA
jgi:hypothetical protein